jgi:hypothetical protein
MANTREPTEHSTKLPFWIHQVAEYGIALVTASSGARTSNRLYPMIAAAVVLVLAATADGPLSAFRSVPRRTHRIADLSVAGVFIVGAIALRSTMGSAAFAIVLGAGVMVAALSWRTDYRPKPIKVRRARRQRPVTQAVKTQPGPESAGSPEPTPSEPRPVEATPRESKPAGPILGNERAENIGRGAGRVAAGGVRAWRARKGR